MGFTRTKKLKAKKKLKLLPDDIPVENRIRGAVIIHEPRKGIPLVEGEYGKRSLPGGGAKEGEDSRGAARREADEEMGAWIKLNKLFRVGTHKGNLHKNGRGFYQNQHDVFFATQVLYRDGRPVPGREIHNVTYWKPGESFKNVSSGTRTILQNYLELRPLLRHSLDYTKVLKE